MDKKNLKLFGVGTVVAVIYFFIYNAIVDFAGITWQEIMVSVFLGLVFLGTHMLIRQNGPLKALGCILMGVFIFIGLAWLYLCIGMEQWAANY